MSKKREINIPVRIPYFTKIEVKSVRVPLLIPRQWKIFKKDIKFKLKTR